MVLSILIYGNPHVVTMLGRFQNGCHLGYRDSQISTIVKFRVTLLMSPTNFRFYPYSSGDVDWTISIWPPSRIQERILAILILRAALTRYYLSHIKFLSKPKRRKCEKFTKDDKQSAMFASGELNMHAQ